MSRRLNLSALILFASILLLVAAVSATDAPAEPGETTVAESASADGTAVWPLTAPWMSSDSMLMSSSCVPTTCLIDFLCYQACEAGPEDEFCSCIQGCLIFCA